jgi:hypothetical protein
MARKTVDGSPSEQASSEIHNEFGELAADVQRAYDEGVSLEEAERLAAKFLGAQMRIAEELARVETRSPRKTFWRTWST